jgi:flavin-dependent dehydrogenase
MEYDIIVVGAGPAGSAFCRQAARGGASILLIDGQTPDNKKPCGGLLAPDAQKLFAHFDFTLPKDVLADPQIFSVKTIDLRTGRIRYYRRCYLNMDRYAFDRFLLSLVHGKVERLAGRCLSVKKQDGLFCVRIRGADGTTRECSAKRLVGADGASSLVRSTLFRAPICRYVAIQQWFPARGESNPFYSCIFDPQTSESCSWLMYKGDYVIYGGCFSPAGCREAFEKQKLRLEAFLGYSFGEAARTEACMADRPKHLRDFVTGADGAYLIGEAAGFISASSFEGISSAIRSGSLLADAILQGGGSRAEERRYRRATAGLRFRLLLKTRKRWFMYTPWVRSLIMRLGIASIRVQTEEGGNPAAEPSDAAFEPKC